MKAIKTMNPSKSITRRWIHTINCYNFEVYHIKEKLNTFSDFLSKGGLQNVEPNEGQNEDDDNPLVICAMEDNNE